MLYAGIMGYMKKLIIYFKSWRIVIPILLTLYIILVDQSASYFTNYTIAYVLWTLFYAQSVSKRSKEMRMLCLLPSNTRLRTIHLMSEAIGMTIVLTLWRISIYAIEMLLNLCTLQEAAHRFFGMDLIIILLISMIPRISVGKAKYRNNKNKRVANIVLILSTILLCIHIILFILNIEQVWLVVPFTTLAYLSVAAMWCVMLPELRSWNYDYETMLVKPVKK